MVSQNQLQTVAMMGATPLFARMIVNQEIREQELPDTKEGKIGTESRQLATENFRMPPSCDKKKKANVRKRRVRFPTKAELLITVIFIPKATQQENRALWYTSRELDRIQERSDADCLRAMKRQEGSKGFLDSVFLADSHHVRQRNLNCWCRYSDNLRGFEHIVNKSHSVERYVQKSINIKSVLVAQRDCRDEMTPVDMSFTLARISERCSKRAREFATALGEADAYAETLDRNSQLAIM